MHTILDTIKRDDEGYLLNLADWDQNVAAAIALSENITLTEEHWQIIDALRDFYAEYNTSPSMRALLNLLNRKLNHKLNYKFNHKLNKKIDSIYLHTLFPGGPAKQANKIAGLPKPVRCI